MQQLRASQQAGATIGGVDAATFASVLEAPVLLVGLGLEEDRLHSPNEKFDIPNFENGVRAIARILDRIAESGK